MLLVDIHQTIHIVRGGSVFIDSLGRSSTSYTIIAFEENFLRKFSVILLQLLVFNKLLVEIGVDFVASPPLHIILAM